MLLKQGWCAGAVEFCAVLLAAAFPLLPASGRGPEGVVLEQAGYIVPGKLVSVSPQVRGQVIQLNIVEGQIVKKGDVLARLDSAIYKAKVEGAKARVDIATAELARFKGAAPEQDLVIARAKVRQTKAKLQIAQWRLDATVIRAPSNGTILAKKTEQGNVVSPLASNSALAAGICEMADLRELEVEVSIQERDIRRIVKGQLCHVQLDAIPKALYKGHVSRLSPIADRAKGVIPVRVKIEVPERDMHLRLEMRAKVQFLTTVR
jgi:RND family efflux transporter MFP subunit